MGSYNINDPIHHIMVFTEDEKKLLKHFMDTELFQRLRRIKQLGCGDLIFPGAVHTRFNHCVGASYLAKRLYQSISCDLDLNDKQKNMEWQQIMVAALLHDIGHGPFSHAFEKLFDEKFKEELNGNKGKIKKCKISHDDDWLKKFLGELEFNDENLQQGVNAVLLGTRKDYLTDIISSQLDVDRMDYLLRDSHFCGVPYGKIDLKWLISSANIVEVDHKKRLGITKKGIGALEHFILARRLMTRNIYFHGKIKAAEYLVREFLHGLIEYNEKYLMNKTMLGKFLSIYYEYSNNVVKLNTELEIKETKKNFINAAFKYYSKITDDDIWFYIKQYSSSKKTQKCFIIAKRLITRSLPHYYLIDSSRVSKTKLVVEKYKSELKINEKWKIHTDTLEFTSYKSDKEPIYINENDSVRNISHASTVLNFLSDRDEPNYYLYLDKFLDKNISTKLLQELKDAYCLLDPNIMKNDVRDEQS